MLGTILYLIDLNYKIILYIFEFLNGLIVFLSQVADSIEALVKFICEFIFLIVNFVIGYFFNSKIKTDSAVKTANINSNNNQDYVLLNFDDQSTNFCFYNFFENFLNILFNNLNILILLNIFGSCLLYILYQKFLIKRLERSNSILKQAQLVYCCVICQQETSSILLLPCKHLCCCFECFNLMTNNNTSDHLNCPLCRYFVILQGTCPLDAFKTGVKVEPIRPNLLVNILDVDKSFNTSNIEINEISSKFDLTNIKRIYNLDNRPSNKLMASCRSISSFIRILKYGIKIGNKQHLVVPNIVNYRLCENCCGLNHRQNNYVKEKRCLKCAESGHETKECKSKLNQLLSF
ncbi:unnamed protein product [Brachionus calyciflorus]|uniref:RING-type domain-containing protein n=1 Tax=Brachionus calyciflorus TaxID=104777 RepID=A0A813UL72_9BILA|nr:unnamed protein product [Brachionus calyciflorus]